MYFFMYYYILDQQSVSPEKFERMHVQLQGMLTEFNIGGEFARVTSLRPMKECVATAVQRGVKTLVACGSDETFNLMLAHLQGRDFVIAYIPFDPENSFLAKILGLKDLKTSVKTIAARRIEKIDLAKVGSYYFISSLEFGVTSQNLKQSGIWNSLKMLSAPGGLVHVRIDDSYELELNCLGGLVTNARTTTAYHEQLANPTDGYLDLLILEKLTSGQTLTYRNAIAQGLLEKVPNTTIIKCRKIDFLEPAGFPLSISHKVLTKFPATVQIIPKQLRLIVGKDRTF